MNCQKLSQCQNHYTRNRNSISAILSSMKKYLILFLFTICSRSAFSAQIDATTFFSQFPSSYICQGTKEIFNEAAGKLGGIRVTIAGSNTQSPVVEVTSEDGNIKYKIGDGFEASLEKSVMPCGYHFADNPARMFYVCGMDIPNPASFQQVMRADLRITFSRDLICTGGPTCIRLSACK